MLKLSIIIPARNEAQTIGPLLESLQALRARGDEVIVIDGGSEDETLKLARSLCDKCLLSKAGRAKQMRKGAAIASGDILWFLHADSHIHPDSKASIMQALQRASWGGFAVRLSGKKPLLRVVECLMNFRSRLTGVFTGDQGIFVMRELFFRVGGFHDLPLMEDIELSTRLKRVSRPVLVCGARLGTSSRRWESRGVIRTVVRMWLLRLAFYLGVPARLLAPYYT